MKLVAVEANIAVGKSTMIPQLAKELGYEEIQEPVDDPMFLELLKDFTENPNDATKRLRFQMYITNTRSELVKTLDPTKNYIIERSLFSDLVFSQCNMLGTERPSGEYLSYYYDIKRRLTDYPQVNAIVYLQCDPKISYQRIAERNRGAEDGTPLSYIEDLARFHDACLPQIAREYNTDLITVNWDQFGDVKKVAQMVKEMIAKQD